MFFFFYKSQRARYGVSIYSGCIAGAYKGGALSGGVDVCVEQSALLQELHRSTSAPWRRKGEPGVTDARNIAPAMHIRLDAMQSLQLRQGWKLFFSSEFTRKLTSPSPRGIRSPPRYSREIAFNL